MRFLKVRCDELIDEPKLYLSENVVKRFLDDLKIEVDVIRSKLTDPHIMILGEMEQKAFNNATYCYLCDKILGDN